MCSTSEKATDHPETDRLVASVQRVVMLTRHRTSWRIDVPRKRPSAVKTPFILARS